VVTLLDFAQDLPASNISQVAGSKGRVFMAIFLSPPKGIPDNTLKEVTNDFFKAFAPSIAARSKA
jgi:hypothetical protein